MRRFGRRLSDRVRKYAQFGDIVLRHLTPILQTAQGLARYMHISVGGEVGAKIGVSAGNAPNIIGMAYAIDSAAVERDRASGPELKKREYNEWGIGEQNAGSEI